MVRDIISLNSSFNNFPSAWHMVGVFKDVLLNIRTSVLYDRNFSLCVLIPRYGCFMVELCMSQIQSLHRIWSFSLRMFSVNVFKSAVSCGFGYIYWRNLFTFTEEIFNRKFHFWCSEWDNTVILENHNSLSKSRMF